MHNICWQFFKKSGSIEAYLYINNRQALLKDKEKALTNLQGQNRIIQHEIDLKEKYIIYANNKITYFQEAFV